MHAFSAGFSTGRYARSRSGRPRWRNSASASSFVLAVVVVEWLMKVILHQFPQLVRGYLDITKNASQGSLREIFVSVYRNHYNSSIRMLQEHMTSCLSLHQKSTSFQYADQLFAGDCRQFSHDSRQQRSRTIQILAPPEYLLSYCSDAPGTDR